MNTRQRDQVISVVRAWYPQSKQAVSNPAAMMVLDYLTEDETLEACMFTGICLRGKERMGESGCLWVTDKRLIFVGLRSVFAKQPTMVEFSFRVLQNIEPGKGGILGFGGEKVTFDAEGKHYVFISSIENGMVHDLIDLMRLKALGESATLPPAAEPPAQVDLATQLQQLAQLRSQGALTEEEFHAAKEKILHS